MKKLTTVYASTIFCCVLRSYSSTYSVVKSTSRETGGYCGKRLCNTICAEIQSVHLCWSIFFLLL